MFAEKIWLSFDRYRVKFYFYWSLVAFSVTVKRAIDFIFYQLDDVDVSARSKQSYGTETQKKFVARYSLCRLNGTRE